jgi:membrane-associated protease RseP (regulator of RpoE activity)
VTDLQQRHDWPPPDPAARQQPDPSSGGSADKGNLGRLAILGGLAVLLGVLYSWWALVLVAGFLLMLFVHELGHYLAARRAGMKVTEFFLGFGPRIWSYRRGETEYGLKVIPLGAYVRIIGMNNLEEVDPADEDRTYRAKGYWSRFCVAVAGVAMNFALALVLLFIALVGFGVPTESSWSVSSVSADSPATQAGIESGDRITEVDGQPVATWSELTTIIRSRPGETVTLTVVRDGEELTKSVTLAQNRPDSADRVGFLGVGPVFGNNRVPVLEGVQQSFSEFGRVSWLSTVGLKDVFSSGGVRNYSDLLTNNPGADPNQRLLSPVGAVKVGTEVAEQDFSSLILLLAAINIMVGLLNLIPLLPFDGGHIAIATYEAIRSRKGKPYRADITKILPLSYGVLAVVAVMFVVNVYLDIVRL